MLRPELRLTVGSFVCTTQFPLHETFGPEYIGLFSSHAKSNPRTASSLFCAGLSHFQTGEAANVTRETT
jgi:hypothetical protein